MTTLIFASAIGAALVSGIFYAFSTFVMRALERLPPRDGIAAMQSINIAVINPLFFLVFFGTGVLCVVTTAASLMSDLEVSLGPVIIGCVLYLFGCIGITIVGNVPLNDKLANTDPDGPEAETLWSLYLGRWNLWNHLRTAASLAAAVSFLISAGAT